MVPIEYHEMCCQSIHHALRRFQDAKLYDDVKIFVRNEMLQPEQNNGVTLTADNPNNVCTAYQNEINRPWPPQLQECYRNRRDHLIDMMQSRCAPRQEIDQCKRLLELPDERSKMKKHYLYH